MIQTIHDHRKFLVSHGMKRSGLGQVLTHQTVSIFVGSTLPRRVGFSEVRCGIEGVINISVPGELQSVVEGQRADACLNGASDCTMASLTASLVLLRTMGQETKAGLALDQAYDGLLVAGADQRIAFPVADTATELDASRTL